MTQEITAHRIHGVSNLNDAITVAANGDPGNGGAHFKYSLYYSVPEFKPVIGTTLQFQQGNPAAGINGISNEALLAVLIHRMQGFQSGQFSSWDNVHVLTHLEEAMLWMKKRTIERAERGVLGELVK